MSRAIVWESEVREGTRGAAGRIKADDYPDRLVKLIPAEVVSVYLALVGIARADEGMPVLGLWIMFLFGLVATFLYSRIALKITDPRQLLVTLGAFSTWAMAMDGPFQQIPGYRDSFGAMIVPAYTLLMPLITPYILKK